MNPLINPYAPGAGTPPPELAGRDSLLEDAKINLARLALGLSGRGMMLYGLRGVGKTVLLRQMFRDAEAANYLPVSFEAPEGRSLPSILLPALRSTIVRYSAASKAKAGFRKVLGTLASFAKAFKVKYEDVEFSIDLEPTVGVADSGDLENDLFELLQSLGEIAKSQKTVMAMFVDELQYVQEDQLAALVMALHRISQFQLPVTILAAGLPQLLGQLAKAKSYAERMFDFKEIGPLDAEAARDALVIPAQNAGVQYNADAVDHIIDATERYPYFLQEWGQHAWRIARETPITFADAEAATISAISHLDSSFFRVRFDRLTPLEKRYMRAMAELGPGPHRSGDVADILRRDVRKLGPCRSALIKKGMAYSPSHGDIAFTVPLFDGFMKRIMHLETD
jgi:hypothetical protein